MKSALNAKWLEQLSDQFERPYMQTLAAFLQAERSSGKTIYPLGAEIFNAFTSTPFDQVKVVILGQDPYHGADQAHGLSFSVRAGVKVPPSLKNIFKEQQQDLGISQPEHGCLQSWADQGVLLLNATLTVEQAQAGSHQKKGWETFTDSAIQSLSDGREELVFLLWGSYAQKKGRIIDASKHLVLKAPHPSPLSAHRGFLGCRHFSQVNHYLQGRGQAPIQWQLPEQ